MTKQEIVELANKLGDKARGDHGFFVRSDVVRAAVAHGLRMGAELCDLQADEPECPERANYCADALRAKADELEAAQ